MASPQATSSVAMVTVVVLCWVSTASRHDDVTPSTDESGERPTVGMDNGRVRTGVLALLDQKKEKKIV